MELKDTIELMNSSDYKERFKAEYLQVKIRYDKLHKMLVKWDAGTLNFTPTCAKALFGSSASVYVKPSTYEATLVMGGMAVNIIAKMPNSTNVVSNNDACGIDARIAINFYG